MKDNMLNREFESELVAALQPIRQFVLASSLYQLFETGVYDLIFKGALTIEEICKEFSFDRKKLSGLLQYLQNEDIVVLSEESVTLSEKGRSYARFEPWYRMLIGGYGKAFLSIGEKLPANSGSAERDIVQVGIGSCGISHYDAFPMTKKMVDVAGVMPKVICDLGCGNGMYLHEFLKYFPDALAVGVEPDERSCHAARTFLIQNGREDRIKIVCDSAISFIKNEQSYVPDIYILGFVLHEILGQDGEQAVIDFLVSIKNKNKNSKVVIIEVDDQITNADLMQQGLSLGYYNYYYLIHYFTNQKLEKTDYWETLFNRAGYKIDCKEYGWGEFNSKTMEVGYLLSAG